MHIGSALGGLRRPRHFSASLNFGQEPQDSLGKLARWLPLAAFPARKSALVDTKSGG